MKDLSFPRFILKAFRATYLQPKPTIFKKNLILIFLSQDSKLETFYVTYLPI